MGGVFTLLPCVMYHAAVCAVSTLHPCLQEKMAPFVHDNLCSMPLLQQLSLDMAGADNDNVFPVCELDTMTALTKLQLSMSDRGFEGLFARFDLHRFYGSLSHAVLPAVTRTYRCAVF